MIHPTCLLTETNSRPQFKRSSLVTIKTHDCNSRNKFLVFAKTTAGIFGDADIYHIWRRWRTTQRVRGRTEYYHALLYTYFLHACNDLSLWEKPLTLFRQTSHSEPFKKGNLPPRTLAIYIYIYTAHIIHCISIYTYTVNIYDHGISRITTLKKN